MSRREFLKAGAAAGVAGAAAGSLSASHGRLIENALAVSSGGSLHDVHHIVILMQENRSFDHYFGTMPGVRGYNDTRAYRSFAGGPRTDPRSVFAQTMEGTAIGGAGVAYQLSDGSTSLSPFELVSNPPTVAGQTTNDITHDWGPQHGAWNNGAMNRWAVEHLANDPTAKWQFDSVSGAPVPATSNWPTGITTMGYYRSRDCLAFYRALADAFTICDGYHCSVLGPTDPNRLMSVSGSLGAHSLDSGGVVLTTYVSNRGDMYGTLDWPTMPELLRANEISWKVYQDPTSNVLFNVLPYFKNYLKPSTPDQVQTAADALGPVYPAEFQADVAAGTLPMVSWIHPPAPSCEHPATPPEYGEYLVSQILQTLVSNPDVWQHTVFLVVYDENGGFFDHVSPPTPGPTATVDNGLALSGARYDGEYVDPAHTTNAAGSPPSDWAHVLGPVGLGFRTPALVVSPFSAGGWVNSDTFDHVSVLKLIESVFLAPGTIMGPGGLHVSPWRYGTVGDMTSALPTLGNAQPLVGPLPPTSLLFPDTAEEQLLNALAGTSDDAQGYPPPPSNSTDYLTPDSASVPTRRPTPG
ncbi:MAG TPA: alkaline phosphatase family protein [Acidimicrobiales bacterium]|nr:alkaline phosphatase family protein [Acidimicrobiales bacterium]